MRRSRRQTRIRSSTQVNGADKTILHSFGKGLAIYATVLTIVGSNAAIVGAFFCALDNRIQKLEKEQDRQGKEQDRQGKEQDRQGKQQDEILNILKKKK